MCLAWKNLAIVWLSVVKIIGVLVSHKMCLNSSKDKCIAENFLVNFVNFCPCGESSRAKGCQCQLVNLYCSFIWFVFDQEDLTAACSLASQMITNCNSGWGTFSDNFIAFDRHSFTSKISSLSFCFKLKRTPLWCSKSNGNINWRDSECTASGNWQSFISAVTFLHY